MVSLPSRKRVPALLLVLLAVGLVAGSGWLVYDDFRPSYVLTATPVEEAPADADVLAVEDLSSEAKTAFEKARKGGYVVHQRPAWLDTFPQYEEVYVEDDGQVYELWTRSDGLRGASLVLAVPAVLLALGLSGLGAWSYRGERVRPPLTALAVLSAGVAVNLAWPFHGILYVAGIPVGPAKVTVVAAVAAAIGAWVGLDQHDFA